MMAAMRARGAGIAGWLLLALLIHLTASVPARLAASAGLLSATADLVVICSEGGVHVLSPEDRPTEDPSSPGKTAADHDCCTPACCCHGLPVAAAVAASPRLIRWREPAPAAQAAAPETASPSPFEARGPPPAA